MTDSPTHIDNLTDNCNVPKSWNDTSVSSKSFPVFQNKDNVLAVSQTPPGGDW